MAGALLTAGPLALRPAHADTSEQASATVQQLLAKVHNLQVRAKVAEHRYSLALNAVQDSVTTAILADQANQASADRVDAARATLADQIRGIYESGGQFAADASVLASQSVNELYDRSEFVSRLVNAQLSNVRTATSLATAADQAMRASEQRAHRSVGTARTVQVAADRVERLLSAQKALLKQANQHLAAVRAAQARLLAQTNAFSSITTQSVAGLHVLPPSAEYLALYQSAATTCPNLSWTILAAIGQIETGHGRNTNTSSAGAQGPMQFEPATFAAYAVDGDHDGRVSIDDPADAIYTAAHYLCANGAGASAHGLSGAILHYNHAVWYLDMVLTLSKLYAKAYA
jgi:membrane-bound lytic murein transglycosylase B